MPDDFAEGLNSQLYQFVEQECPAAGCDQAVVTDTLRVKTFATLQLSTRYASAHGLDHAGTIVVSFAPPLTATERAQYWEQIQKLISEST